MKEESLLLLSDLQKLINQVVLIDYTIIILGGDPMIVVVCPGFVGLYIPDWYFFVVFEDELLYTMINNSANRWTAWLLAGKAVHLLSG